MYGTKKPLHYRPRTYRFYFKIGVIALAVGTYLSKQLIPIQYAEITSIQPEVKYGTIVFLISAFITLIYGYQSYKSAKDDHDNY